MADILNANSTYASGTNDTASTASDGVTLHAAKNINGALSACVDIETILGVGTTLKGNQTDLVARLAVCMTNAGVLKVNDATAFPGPLDVARGGSGASSLTDGGILLGSGTGAITALGVATNGQIPIGDGTTDPVLNTITGGTGIDVTNGGGTISLAIDSTVVTESSTDTLTNKTLTTPTISATGFTNAQHAHEGATSGGTLGTGAIETSTGSATASATATITMNTYGFFPSVSNSATGLWDIIAVTDVADPGDQTGRFTAFESSGSGTFTARWRYITASDDPTIWVSYDPATGEIVATWASDDPTSGSGVEVDGMISIEFKAVALAVLNITQAAFDQADVKIAAKGWRTKHRNYRALQAMTGDDAPSGWLLDNCKVQLPSKRLVLK